LFVLLLRVVASTSEVVQADSW